MTAATQASGVGVLATVAARAADVTLRTVHDVTGIAAVTDFFSDVWQTPRSTPPYPAEVLHSLVHAGGALHAAYDGPRLAGAHVAVLGTARRRRALPRRGYVRIKLKTEPGWDLGPVRAVRERFRDALPLQVDANTGYSLADAEHLRRLDEFGLLRTEEPLEEDNLHGHARLQRRIATPVCLDESLHNARDTASAVAMEACRIVNVKPARVGGYLEARRVHDVAHAQGVPVWCGGMLETGIGRAPDLALAALPGFTLPGDTSASSRYSADDVTEPFVLADCHVPVPRTPGIGIEPLPESAASLHDGTERPVRRLSGFRPRPRGRRPLNALRQKACLQLMDMYAVFNAESVRRREQLDAGTVLEEASLQSYAEASINLTATCSYLALLGPDFVVQVAGAGPCDARQSDS